MKLKVIYFLLFLPLIVAGQHKKAPNIINYFASNNQIVGVPMVDLDNLFRFYPDLSFQQAISGVEVYYFVLNGVYKHHLIKREDGRYWEATIRDFSLGEAIQRVEVIVDCDVDMMNTTLRKFGIETNMADKEDKSHYYLMLRRGDDKNLYKLKYYSNLRNSILQKITTEILSIKTSSQKDLNTIYGSFEKTKDDLSEIKKIKENFYLAQTNLHNICLEAVTQITRLSQTEKFSPADFILFEQVKETVKRDSISIQKIANNFDSKIQASINKLEKNDTTFSQIEEQIDALLRKFRGSEIIIPDIPKDLFQDRESELLKSISGDASSRLYSAYVENRLSSMLDMRYKDADTTIIQFNYRNDKQSLQYLQADDPQEKLGIFRARLVPFAFYRQTETSGAPPALSETEFIWQRGKIIYEIGINFGYAIVKGDHFTPKFFDMNRLGIGIGITADTFSNDPSFLSVSLTYDINTYSTISFGSTLIDKPGFYVGVGINARAFKDLVKNSATLFKGD